MKVLVVIDSFKGSLTSPEAEGAVAKALGQRWPGCRTMCVPISDGGEGMLGVLLQARGEEVVQVACHDPLRRHIEARYAIIAHDTNRTYQTDVVETAVIETAEASGLSLLRPEERNPLLTNTYGTGELIRHALDRGVRHFIVGLGGSATCDAGLGMMHALGAKLLDKNGRELVPCGGSLERIARIDLSGLHPALATKERPMPAEEQHPMPAEEQYPTLAEGQVPTPAEGRYLTPAEGRYLTPAERSHTITGSGVTFTVACDVSNPFCGTQGAARVFGPQKGANAAGVETLERGMMHIRELIRRQTGIDLNQVPGAGAAGGLGGAFVALLGAELRSGIDLLMDTINLEGTNLDGTNLDDTNLEGHIRQADLVITGEGKADRQTLMGKVPHGVLRRAQRYGVPVVLLAGRVEDADLLRAAGFAQIIQVSPTLQPLAEAMLPDVARENIAKAIAGLDLSKQICF